MTKKRIAVIGGGPIGLMSAHVLSASKNFLVTVFDEPHAKATFPKAGAYWLPFSSGAPAAIEQKFATPTHDFYRDMLSRHPHCGLLERELIVYSCKQGNEISPHDQMTWLKDVVADYRVRNRLKWKKVASFHQQEDGVEASDVSIAPSWSCTTIAINPEQFIIRLKQILVDENEVVLHNKRLTLASALTDEFRRRYDAVVFCGGIRGFENDDCFQLDDQNLRPSKGILARIPTRRKLKTIHTISDQPFSEHPVYFVPLENEVALGGTVVATDLNDVDSLIVSAEEKSQLRSRFAKLMPPHIAAFLDSAEIEWTAGIRPKLVTGPVVELDNRLSDQIKLPLVVNIGHGGSGFTFGIGCGEQVREILLGVL